MTDAVGRPRGGSPLWLLLVLMILLFVVRRGPMNRLGVVPMEDDDDDDRSPILENPLRFISVLIWDLATKLLTLSSAATSLLLLPPAHGEIHGRCVCRLEDRCWMELLGVGRV